MPKTMKSMWYATTNATTTTTDTFANFNNNLWVKEVKYLSDKLAKAENIKPKKKVKKVPASAGLKPKKKEIPLGAHMPNIHPDEIIWGEERLIHSWCRAGDIASEFSIRGRCEREDGLPTKGKPFCMVCKRFLSKRAIGYLRDSETDGDYVRVLEPHVGLGILVVYRRKGNEDYDEDCAAEPPIPEDCEPF